MISLSRALLLAACCIAAPLQAQTPAPLPPVASFFENASFGGARLSPGGRYLAARSGGPGRHDFLAVIDLETRQAKVVASYTDADIGHFQWVNDERLVFDVTDKTVAEGDLQYAPGLFAVNRDGSGEVQLAERQGGVLVARSSTHVGRQLLPWHTFLLDQQGPRNSDWVYVTSPQFDTSGHARYVNLLRLNTVTGKAETVHRPAEVQGWMLDRAGEPRLAVARTHDKTTIWYRDPAGGEWRELASYAAYSGGQAAIRPLGFGADGTLYVVARGDSDTSAVHTFNFKTGGIDPEPLVVTKGYDFDGQLVFGRDKVLGVRFRTDAVENQWFDPGMKALQESVDKALPATVNLVSVPARSGAPWVLVQSYSDAIPASWFLFNTQAGKAEPLGTSRPHIDSRQMGRQDAVRYQARDGLAIPALLTLPHGGGKHLPLVLLVHGGPWVRGASWGWNADSQFLASRGYAVLEPEFRGSTGFGAKHFMAGWKQWGLKMQDDVADGARWAIAQGIADPKRICIAGASYGGYATLMGLANDPGLFKCGIDWVGVTDINLMYDGTWYASSDTSDDFKEYGMPEMVGDQVKDAAQLKATSPLEQAARITQPLLLAYGGADRRVPIYHGKKFYDAVTRTNHDVEWVEYPEEGHGWHLEKNRIDFWTRVEKFLDKHIGKGAVQE